LATIDWFVWLDTCSDLASSHYLVWHDSCQTHSLKSSPKNFVFFKNLRGALMLIYSGGALAPLDGYGPACNLITGLGLCTYIVKTIKSDSVHGLY